MSVTKYPSIRERLKSENPGISEVDLQLLVEQEVNSTEQTPESKQRWSEMLSSWKKDRKSIPFTQGSQWYGPKYSHCLAEYPGDPSAYVSSPHEAREVAKRKGLIGEHTEMEVRS